MINNTEDIIAMSPEPEFGINETVANIYGSNDYYTYYIDTEHSSATDTDNPHGTAALPRLTMPDLSTLTAGDVVEIHGYINTGSTNNFFTVDGTESRPIFIRGKAASEPRIRALFRIQCKYIIFENLIFDQNQEQRTSFSINPQNAGHPIDHISIRNCEVRYYQQTTNTGGNNATMGVSDGGTGQYPNNIVFYRNYIHDNGNSEGGRDIHAILVGSSEYVWIIENEMYNNAGDSVQITTGSDPEYSTEPPTNHIYIARNEMHGEHENAIDLKRCTDVIIEKNVMYDFLDTYGTWGGGAMVFHMGGLQPETPLRILIIHNEIYNCHDNAITTEDGVNEFYVVGNIFYDIGLSSTVEETGVFTLWATGAHYIYNNIFYNAQSAIWITTGVGANNLTSTTDIRNNIIANMRGSTANPLGYHLFMGDANNSPRETHTIFANNLLYQDTGDILFYWNGTNITSFSSFQSISGQGNNCLAGEDPLFIDAVSNNFHINTGSPAINAGVNPGNLLDKSFKIPFLTDFDGNPSPVGLWDIGPYEHQ